VEDRTRNPESSFHSGRELPDRVVSPVVEIYECEQFVYPLAGFVETVEPGVIGQVVCGAQPVGKTVVLEEDADPCACTVVEGEVVPEDPDLPGMGCEEPEKDSDGRGLPGAVRAEVAEYLAVADGESDVAEDLPAVERPREPTDVDGVQSRHLRRSGVPAAREKICIG